MFSSGRAFKYLFIYLFINLCDCDLMESPCPKVFQYALDQRNNLYGDIFVYSPDDNHIQLDVQLSIANRLQQGDNGRLELAYSKERVVNDILKRRPIHYMIFFPYWERFPPKVTRIWLNGIQVCGGNGYDVKTVPILTTVNLQHTLTTNINQMYKKPFMDGGGQNIFNLDPFSTKSNPNDAEVYVIDFNPKAPKDLSKIYPANPFLANKIGSNFIENVNQGAFKSGATTQVFGPYTQTPKRDLVNPFVPNGAPPNFDSAADNYQSKRPQASPDFNRYPNDEGGFVYPTQNTEATAPSCGVSVRGNHLIANGNPVARNMFPWIVAMYRIIGTNDNFTCGGTLISRKHVVTAAHCLKPNGEVVLKPNELIVALGRHNIFSRNEGITIEPADIIVHEDYKDRTKDADIGVVVLKIDVPFSEAIQPICLWSENDDLNYIVGQNGLVVGWGRDEIGTHLTSEPREIVMPVVSREMCHKSNNFFQKVATVRTFCAGNRDGSGPCNGDSGGGFMMLRNGRWTLRGVVSMSILNPLSTELKCDLSQYIVFTDVTKFSTWLNSIVK